MTSDLCQRPRKETHDFHRTNAEKSGILFGVAADGHCLFPAGVQVDRAARRVEASARDQLIRHARALSGLRPAPPPQFGIGGSCPSRSDGPPVAADLPRFCGYTERR